MKKKYCYMDVLRLVSMLAIVYYHMIVSLYLEGAREYASLEKFFQNVNAHLATTGVGIFFMLSGAGLMFSSQKKEFKARDFYKRRLMKILLPFYLVTVLYITYLFAAQILRGGSVSSLIPNRITPLRPILLLLGLDTYSLSFLGGETYYRFVGDPVLVTGIGEWFLGCLVIMYLLFPLIRKALLKNKWLTMAIATVYFALVLVFYSKIPIFCNLPEAPFMNFFVKIYDFVLGMFLALVVGKLPKWTLWPSLAVVLAFLVSPVKFPLDQSVAIVLLNLAIYLLFHNLEFVFEKAKKPMKWISFLCKYTYIFFLWHHIVITHFTHKWVVQCQAQGLRPPKADIPIVFIKEFIVTAILTAFTAMLLAAPAWIKKKRSEEKKETVGSDQ
ncbi:MAG: acyltransferase [Lachnospiraceae bacterium]|nr:acyltransferase [Lachnospiraceae bacterium]